MKQGRSTRQNHSVFAFPSGAPREEAEGAVERRAEVAQRATTRCGLAGPKTSAKIIAANSLTRQGEHMPTTWFCFTHVAATLFSRGKREWPDIDDVPCMWCCRPFLLARGRHLVEIVVEIGLSARNLGGLASSIDCMLSRRCASSVLQAGRKAPTADASFLWVSARRGVGRVPDGARARHIHERPACGASRAVAIASQQQTDSPSGVKLRCSMALGRVVAHPSPWGRLRASEPGCGTCSAACAMRAPRSMLQLELDSPCRFGVAWQGSGALSGRRMPCSELTRG